MWQTIALGVMLIEMGSSSWKWGNPQGICQYRTVLCCPNCAHRIWISVKNYWPGMHKTSLVEIQNVEHFLDDLHSFKWGQFLISPYMFWMSLLFIVPFVWLVSEHLRRHRGFELPVYSWTSSQCQYFIGESQPVIECHSSVVLLWISSLAAFARCTWTSILRL